MRCLRAGVFWLEWHAYIHYNRALHEGHATIALPLGSAFPRCGSAAPPVIRCTQWHEMLVCITDVRVTLAPRYLIR
jgi:hypothetical protein